MQGTPVLTAFIAGMLVAFTIIGTANSGIIQAAAAFASYQDNSSSNSSRSNSNDNARKIFVDNHGNTERRFECIGYNTSVGASPQAEIFIYRQSGGKTKYRARWYRFDGTIDSEVNGEIESGQTLLHTNTNPEIVRVRVSTFDDDGDLILYGRMNFDNRSNGSFVQTSCQRWSP